MNEENRQECEKQAARECLNASMQSLIQAFECATMGADQGLGTAMLDACPALLNSLAEVGDGEEVPSIQCVSVHLMKAATVLVEFITNADTLYKNEQQREPARGLLHDQEGDASLDGHEANN